MKCRWFSARLVGCFLVVFQLVGAQTPVQPPYHAFIGGYEPYTAGNYSHGLIDEVSVYGRPLSAQEIQGIFAVGSADKGKLHQSDQPVLLSPSNGETGVSVNPTLSWGAVSGAISYRLQLSIHTSIVDQEQSFIDTSAGVLAIGGSSEQKLAQTVTAGISGFLTEVRLPVTGPALAVEIQGISGGKPNGAVLASANGPGASVAGARFRSFVMSPASYFSAGSQFAIVIKSISDGVIWSGPVGDLYPSGAGYFDARPNQAGIWVALGLGSNRVDLPFQTIVKTLSLDDSSIVTTSCQVGPLASGSTYCWRVSTRGVTGMSEFATPFHFTTLTLRPSVPAAPSALSATGVTSTSWTANWSQVADATSYRLDVALNDTFTTYVLGYQNKMVNGTGYTVTGLTPNTTYYFRVRAEGPGGTSTSSNVRAVMTAPVSVFAPSTPVPYWPANGSPGVSTYPVLSWNVSSGATSYHLQVSTSSNFGTKVVDDSLLTTNSRQLIALANGVTYYWRVRASNVGGKSAYSITWSFTTVVAAPAAPILVAPSNGTTGVATDATLSWTACNGATSYRLQLSSSASAVDQQQVQTDTIVARLIIGGSSQQKLAQIITAQTSGFVSEIRLPVYCYYGDSLIVELQTVSGVSPSGQLLLTQSFSGNDFLRQYPSGGFRTFLFSRSAYVATGNAYAIVLRSTGYVYIYQSPLGNLYPGGDGLYVNSSSQGVWLRLGSAGRYDLPFQLLLRPVSIDDSTITSTSKRVGPLSNGCTYYWRVCARNTQASSAFSPTLSFRTVSLPPDPPGLFLPANGAHGIATTTTLRWNASAQAMSYNLQVAGDSTFSNLHCDVSGISVNYHTLTGLRTNTTYFWRVAAINDGGTSAFSSMRRFTTLLSVPALVAPPNGATGVLTNVTLAWRSTLGVTSYHLRVFQSYAGGVPLLDLLGMRDTTFSLSGLPKGSTFYWCVRAIGVDDTSTFCQPYRFTTASLLTYAPTLVFPSDGSTNVSFDPVLSWIKMSDAQSYQVQVSLDSLLSSPSLDSSGIAANNLKLYGFLPGTRYFWRVRATNAVGSSAFSTPWSFVTSPVTCVERLAGHIPKNFSLAQNYPNPFNPSTTIRFEIPEAGHVSLKIYDVLGKEAAALLGEYLDPGIYSVQWDAGRFVSGMYFYCLRAGSVVQVKKLTLLR
ncbi:MAG: hypothetical protein A2X66_09700 [Ignavibacteria bacterium GWA2_54_16]|nr:MAG: hypothetical protein A2X66_09700 [Ignavibacteria bacterium GWA2_54_16]